MTTPLEQALDARAMPDDAREAVRPLTFRGLGELMADPTLMTPPDPVLAPLLYPGRVVLLAGREKIGKSTLAGAMVAAVSRGGSCLGEVATRGLVLYFALDEALPDTVQRLVAAGADPANVLLCTERPTVGSLAAALDAHAPALVVVDTLNELLPGTDLKDASKVLPVLHPIIRAIRDANACGLILGHSSKGTGEYLGAVQLGGAVDGIFTLRAYRAAGVTDAPPSDDDDAPVDDGRRVLEGRTRWAGRLKLRLSWREGAYHVGDTPAPLRDRVLHLLSRRDDVTREALGDALGVRRDDIRRELDALQSAGLVTVPGRGKPLTLTPLGDRSLNRPANRPEVFHAEGSGRFAGTSLDIAGRSGTTLDGYGTAGNHEPSQNANLGVAERDGSRPAAADALDLGAA
jgi:hypothetical protein